MRNIPKQSCWNCTETGMHRHLLRHEALNSKVGWAKLKSRERWRWGSTEAGKEERKEQEEASGRASGRGRKTWGGRNRPLRGTSSSNKTWAWRWFLKVRSGDAGVTTCRVWRGLGVKSRLPITRCRLPSKVPAFTLGVQHHNHAKSWRWHGRRPVGMSSTTTDWGLAHPGIRADTPAPAPPKMVVTL